MIHLTTSQSVKLKDGRDLHIVLPWPDDSLNPRTLQGQEILLDGRHVRVRGVETVALEQPVWAPFGLIVEEM